MSEIRLKGRSPRGHAALVVMILIGGCTAAEPMVSMRDDAPTRSYAAVEVPAVTNDTGKSFDGDPAAILTNELRARLAEQGVKVVDGSSNDPDPLVVKSSLISYSPGDPAKAWLGLEAGSAQATVKTTLVDKQSGNVVGTLITPQSERAGLYGYAVPLDKLVLKSVAKGIANEIAKWMK